MSAAAAKRATRIVSHSGRARVKSGMAKLTAVSSGQRTHLTRVSHAAPMRLIPVGSTAVQRAGAALVALSSYGGGMLQGDENSMEILVQKGATLGLVTQGSNRIYKCNVSRRTNSDTVSFTSLLHPSGEEDATCKSNMTATVEKDGLFVMAPDPCVTFSASSFVQDQHVHVEPGASAVVVDWFGAGRVCSGERWDFTKLASRLSLYHEKDNHPYPFLVESVMMDRRTASTRSLDPFGFDAGHYEFNAFCSVVLHGPKVQQVVERCKSLEQRFVAQYTKTRNQQNDNSTTCKTAESHPALNLRSLSGRVLMGVSKVTTTTIGEDESTHVMRLAATCNEDVYRVLHSCLIPLQCEFGLEFYRDRIQASATAATVQSQQPREPNGSKQQEPNASHRFGINDTTSSPLPRRNGHSTWSAYMLADSGLPTGGFAHSSGIEAASQLGLFGNGRAVEEEKVSSYILAATRSTCQFLTPFVMAGHELLSKDPRSLEAIHQQWLDLDAYAQASMASNAPACRASLDQGQGLLRVSRTWLGNNGGGEDDAIKVLSLLQESISDNTHRGHIGPIFGMVGGQLNLTSQEVCHVLGFCAARDMVSAAVRLNLVGPLASVAILDRAWHAVQDGHNVAVAGAEMASQIPGAQQELATVMTAATCSPVAEAVHPCQDLLSVRLFRT